VDTDRDLGQHADRGVDRARAGRACDVGGGKALADGRRDDLALCCRVGHALPDGRDHQRHACRGIAGGQQRAERHGQDAHAEDEQEGQLTAPTAGEDLSEPCAAEPSLEVRYRNGSLAWWPDYPRSLGRGCRRWPPGRP
jgi:hypothetical protein